MRRTPLAPTLVLALATAGIADAAEHPCGTAASPPPVPRKVTAADLRQTYRAPGLQLGTFSIVIVAGPTLQGNGPALAAFERAAAQWESFIADPITITINAELQNLGDPNVIGSTSPFLLAAPLSEIRPQLLSDAQNDAGDAIVASLPSSLTVIYPPGYDPDGDIGVDKAAAKAMGFTGLDAMFGASDADIVFNTQFPFDFDSSNGVGAGLVDFETVAAHEIGHALGFGSSVDFVDVLPPQALPVAVLDFFRFPNDTADDPSSPAEFGTAARSQVPGSADVFDDTDVEHLMSTGAMGGDGRQASHWKDDALTGTRIGMMDPTLADGEVFTITSADLRALDLIGYDIGGGGGTTTTLATCEGVDCDDADACTNDTCDTTVGCVHTPVSIAEGRAAIVDPSLDAACVDSPGAKAVGRLARKASKALGKAELAAKPKKLDSLLRKADNLLFKATLKLSKGFAKGRVSQACVDATEPGLDRASDVVDCVQAAS
jgi:hypothetical protein